MRVQMATQGTAQSRPYSPSRSATRTTITQRRQSWQTEVAMSFQGMGDLSSDEGSLPQVRGEAVLHSAPVNHRHDELQPPIPQRGGLHRSPPPLPRPVLSSRRPARTVNLRPKRVGEVQPAKWGKFCTDADTFVSDTGRSHRAEKARPSSGWVDLRFS